MTINTLFLHDALSEDFLIALQNLENKWSGNLLNHIQLTSALGSRIENLDLWLENNSGLLFYDIKRFVNNFSDITELFDACDKLNTSMGTSNLGSSTSFKRFLLNAIQTHIYAYNALNSDIPLLKEPRERNFKWIGIDGVTASIGATKISLHDKELYLNIPLVKENFTHLKEEAVLQGFVGYYRYLMMQDGVEERHQSLASRLNKKPAAIQHEMNMLQLQKGIEVWMEHLAETNPTRYREYELTGAKTDIHKWMASILSPDDLLHQETHIFSL